MNLMDIETINKAISDTLIINWKEGLLANSNGIIGVTIMAIVCVLFSVQAIKKKQVKHSVMSVIACLLLLGSIVLVVQTVQKEEMKKIETFTAGHKYAEEGTYKDLNSPYIPTKVEGMIATYLRELPKERTRQYEDIQTDRNGNIFVKLNGDYVRAFHQPNVVIDITKKPLVTYSLLPNDIIGVFKKGDIVNVWVVNE